MKKRDKEELISKSVVFTVIIFAIMFCTMLIQNAYFKIPPTAMSLATPTIVLVTSILSLVIAVVFVVFGFVFIHCLVGCVDILVGIENVCKHHQKANRDDAQKYTVENSGDNSFAKTCFL